MSSSRGRRSAARRAPEGPKGHRDKYATKVPGGRDRSCRKRDGTPKRKYATKADAERVVIAALEQGKPPMRSYQCPVCGAWHTGTIGKEA